MIIKSGKKWVKETSHFICLISIKSVLEIGKKYYPEVFSEQCKFIVIENKIKKYISDKFDLVILTTNRFMHKSLWLCWYCKVFRVDA